MIERATQCLNRGGRAIVTGAQGYRKSRRCLHTSFWSHGAHDIDLPSWWNDFLCDSASRGAIHGAPSQHVAPVLRSSFLEFLYPPKALAFAQTIAARPCCGGGRARKRLLSTTGKRESARTKRSKETIAQSATGVPETRVDEESAPASIDDEALSSQRASSKGAADHDLEDAASAESDLAAAYQPEPSKTRPQSKPNPGYRRKSRQTVVEKDLSQEELERIQTSAAAEVERYVEVFRDVDDSPVATAVERQYASQAQIPIDDAIDEVVAANVSEDGQTETPTVRSTFDIDSDKDKTIIAWRRKSKELAQAYANYSTTITNSNMIPQLDDNFRSTLAYEVPIIQWQLETTFDAGTNFYHIFLKHLHENVLPKDRQKWTEKQWSIMIYLTLRHPVLSKATSKRLNLTNVTFPIGTKGAFGLLDEAFSLGKASMALQTLLAFATEQGLLHLFNALTTLGLSRGLSREAVFAFVERIDTPELVQIVSRLAGKLDIPRALRARKDLYSAIRPDRPAYLSVIYLLTQYILRREFSSNVNMAALEKIWIIFSKQRYLTLQQHEDAIRLLLSVDSSSINHITAFVALAFKIFNTAQSRADFRWSQAQTKLLLKKMILTKHPQCWNVFSYYRQHHGYDGVVWKGILPELSRSGQAERWSEVYAELEANEQVEKLTWIPQLAVAYSKRGDVAACRELLESIARELSVPPSIEIWNAVLHAYVQCDDMSGAIEFVEYMTTQGVKPDVGTRTTILRGYTGRGETALATEQIEQIQKEGFQLTAKMVEHLVYSNVVNEDMESAEQVLGDTVQLNKQDSMTTAWNVVLMAYAHQNKIDDVNRLHRLMNEHGIEEDATTYAAIMQALCMANRPNIAFRIMAETMPARNMVPTIHHCNILMNALLRTEEYQFVLKIYQVARKQYLKPDVTTRTLAVKAISSMHGSIKKSGQGWRDLKDIQARALANAEEFLRQALQEDQIQNAVSPSEMIGRKGEPKDLAYASMQFQPLLEQYALLPDGGERVAALVKQYEDFYRNAYPGQEPKLPQRILLALGNHHLAQNDLDAFADIWQTSLSSLSMHAARTGADVTQPGWVLPSRSTQLAPIFRLRMIELMRRREFATLRQEIQDLTTAGWRFPSAIWNRYVQKLAEEEDIYAALSVCEQYLMPGFPGWPLRTSRAKGLQGMIDVKPVGSIRSTVPKPAYKTLVWLAKSYIDFCAGNTFSVQREDRLAELHEMAPRTIEAITSMPRTGDNLQRDLLRGEVLRMPYPDTKTPPRVKSNVRQGKVVKGLERKKDKIEAKKSGSFGVRRVNLNPDSAGESDPTLRI